MSDKIFDPTCIFCEIAQGKSPSDKVWENEEFLAFKNKYPDAPIDVLVIPKYHFEKKQAVEDGNEAFHGKLLTAVYQVVKKLGLDASGYKLVINGAGYNHLEHEHVHIWGHLPKDKI